MKNILIGVSGSVATTLLRKLVDTMKTLGEVRIVATKAAMYFMAESLRKELSDEGIRIYVDEDEWSEEWRKGSEILHIELRRWASCFIIAPCSANTLAKIANGICDNLLTSIVRAWDYTRPLLLAPAMNTHMWENSPTDLHIKEVRRFGIRIIDPEVKKLACGDVGIGGMGEIDELKKIVDRMFRWHFPLEKCVGVPINHHPGAFGFHRRKNHHTGVDLYCKDGDMVYAVESGVIVKLDIFTGPKLGHDWWEETWGLMVEGSSGVVNYGEITPKYSFHDTIIGRKVQRGEYLGIVKRVLFPDKLRPDIPGHSCSMLHLELYKHGAREFAGWHEPAKNPELLDPTQFLLEADNSPRKTLTWENEDSKTVG